MKIALCDDNVDFVNQFKEYVSILSRNDLDYDTFFNGEELISLYKYRKADYDAIFLDMELETLDGIEIANHIRKYDKYVIIVFVTNYTKYMQRSFECSPFRFLLKPISQDDVNKVMNEIAEKLSEEKKTFVFSENRNKLRIFSDEIIFFESQSHWLHIHTSERVYKISKTMSSLCDQIDLNEFCRIHNSYTINLNFVKEIKNMELVLHGNIKIPIGRAYKKNFIDSFVGFKERKYVI